MILAAQGSGVFAIVVDVARICGYCVAMAGFAHIATESHASRTDPSAFSSPVPCVSASGMVPSARRIGSAVYCSVAFMPFAVMRPGETVKYDVAQLCDSSTVATTPVVTAVAMLVPLNRRYHLLFVLTS